MMLCGLAKLCVQVRSRRDDGEKFRASWKKEMVVSSRRHVRIVGSKYAALALDRQGSR